jgi:hypothetical protein
LALGRVASLGAKYAPKTFYQNQGQKSRRFRQFQKRNLADIRQDCTLAGKTIRFRQD